MKIVTLNTHSIVENDYENKLKSFVDMIIAEKPFVFGLQEVNQSQALPEAGCERLVGNVMCEGVDVTIRENNHALRVAEMLHDTGLEYEWVWIPLKVGYDSYDEGLAIFSLSKIIDTRQFYISNIRDYNNWKTRKMLGIKTADYSNIWFYTTHLGWWDDEEEPFANQWDIVTSTISEQINDGEICYIMGDFNCPDKIVNQGYDYVKASGWYDLWELAEDRDSGITVGHVIDGWHERIGNKDDEAVGMRLDYIWCNKKIDVKSSRVICNGTNYDVVSDHYGVLADIG